MLGSQARAVAFLAAFGVVALLVAGIATRGGGGSDQAPGTNSSEQDDCWAPLRDLLAPPEQDGDDAGAQGETLDPLRLLSQAEQRARDDDDCMREGEATYVVVGLPDVSGVYSSRDGNLALEGFSFDERAGFEPIGRCFVDPTHVFRSKGVYSTGQFTQRNDAGVEVLSGSSELITVDIGRTGGGGPYAAVVAESLTTGGDESSRGDSFNPDFAVSLVTHNYNPGQDGAVAASFSVWDEERWTGVATFKSTGEAHTYNNRDYIPWTDSDSRTAPNYSFTIALFCK